MTNKNDRTLWINDELSFVEDTNTYIVGSLRVLGLSALVVALSLPAFAESFHLDSC